MQRDLKNNRINVLSKRKERRQEKIGKREIKTEKGYHHKYNYMEMVECLESQVRISVDFGTFTFVQINMGKA